LPIELNAARAVLDEIYDAHDIPQYILGRIGRHNAVVGCLPAGQISLSTGPAVAADMHHIFPSLKHGLMVGVAGGVPSATADIRLGDVVISQPQGSNGGVVQYDFGKTLQDGKFMRTGSLNSPPRDLLIAVARLQANNADGRRRVRENLSVLTERPQLEFASPPDDTDRLFESSFNHIGGESCTHCLLERTIRRPRPKISTFIHYGT